MPLLICDAANNPRPRSPTRTLKTPVPSNVLNNVAPVALPLTKRFSTKSERIHKRCKFKYHDGRQFIQGIAAAVKCCSSGNDAACQVADDGEKTGGKAGWGWVTRKASYISIYLYIYDFRFQTFYPAPPKWRRSSDITIKGYFLALLNSITVHFHFFRYSRLVHFSPTTFPPSSPSSSRLANS